MLFCHKDATVAVEKLKDLVIHENPAGINGNLLEGRIRFDAFVLDVKFPLGAVYGAGTVVAAPTIKYTASSTNTIAITSTTSDAVIKHTPRRLRPQRQPHRPNLQRRHFHLRLAANGETKVRAYAYKDGNIASTVVDEIVPVATPMARL